MIDLRYGKMRPTYNHTRLIAHYRCLAKERGYTQCEQGYILVNSVDGQVVHILSHLEIPYDYRERVEQAVRNNIENEASLKHIAEIEEKVKRIDFSWENGFMPQSEYLEKRHQLQQEMEALRPVDYDDLMEAADLLINFRTYWDECRDVEEPDEARKQLFTKIVDRVYVYNQLVIAVVLHGDFSVILDQEALVPRETINRLAAVLRGT